MIINYLANYLKKVVISQNIRIYINMSKPRFPKLSYVSFKKNKFNCSFSDQIKDYLDKAPMFIDGSISCIGDEEYATIVGDRQINTPESSQCLNMQWNLEEECKKITIELKINP